jgi:hypothetical protein
MLDQLLQTVINHKETAISKEAYRLWKDDPVTKQLFFDAASACLDELTDPLPTGSIADVGAIAVSREAARNVVESVIEWQPAEVEDEQ